LICCPKRPSFFFSGYYNVKIPSRENLNTYTVYDSNIWSVEVQDTFVTLDAVDDYRWMEVQLQSFLTSAQELGEWSASRTGHLLTGERRSKE
jgi:hypothetical protein